MILLNRYDLNQLQDLEVAGKNSRDQTGDRKIPPTEKGVFLEVNYSNLPRTNSEKPWSLVFRIYIPKRIESIFSNCWLWAMYSYVPWKIRHFDGPKNTV